VSGLQKSEAAARVRIPADVEREDRLLANLTARQLAILGVAGLVLWAAYDATRHLVPVVVFAGVAAPLAAVAVVLALGQMGGMSADRLVVAAWRQHRSPRRMVPAPEGVPDAREILGVAVGPLPSPLCLPLVGIGEDGVIDLGPDGLAVVCRASAVTFSLRTPVEQEALVAGFGRYLNSLAEPAQLLIRAEPIDLTPAIAQLERIAPGLPHPGLEEAAREHARFLSELAANRDLLRREVLLILRQPAGDGERGRLRRRAEEATAALAAAGVTLVLLVGEEAGSCLSRALDPAAPLRQGGLGTGAHVVTKAATDRVPDHRRTEQHRDQAA
jgi:hypothetical protein